MTDQCRAKARRRAEGIKCSICGIGPCQAALLACPRATGSIAVSVDGFDAFLHALDNPKSPTQALRDLMRSVPPWSVPNRLYGATITPEGDAI